MIDKSHLVEAIKVIQDEHENVELIDALPLKMRNRIWARISKKAIRNLESRGVFDFDESATSYLELIIEKAKLTDDVESYLQVKKSAL